MSPANITMATCSDLALNDQDHSFLQLESDNFFSQKTIAPSPMTTPSTRNINRPGRPARYPAMMFDERDEYDEEEEEDEEEENDGEEEDDDRYDNDDIDIDEDDHNGLEEGEEHCCVDDDSDDDHDNTPKLDDSRDDTNNMQGDGEEEQDMDRLFLSPPMRSSQTQQCLDFPSPDTFEQVMDDNDTLQSTPKIYGSQIMRTRTRRGSEMSEC